MTSAMATFNINDAITKAVSAKMNFGQVLLVRGLFAIVLIAALAWLQRALRPLRALMMMPVVLRVAGEVGGTILLLVAIVNLPLANAAAIIQVLPLAVTLGAALAVGEPVGWRRWLAIAAFGRARGLSNRRSWSRSAFTLRALPRQPSHASLGVRSPSRSSLTIALLNVQ
ncbi:EamA family transporter [Bradyrhizobium sp. ORS 111]|uniref:EamA family transporter n=1 Tax=Bradyrhizobium sp. ORS 111 TaxID=1685958 RepID=UPI003890BFEA